MSTDIIASRRPRYGATVGIVLAAAFGLAGCGGGGEDTTVGVSTPTIGDPVRVYVNAPADIAQVSADNYDDNVNGLITDTTLKRWIDDWAANRPAGITGRLIILQVNKGPAGSEYITPNPAGGVLTYSIPSSRLTMDRSNGVTTTRTMVPDGAAMDAFLSDYGIDPTKDMLVCAMGAGSAGAAMSMGRCWYMMRYWGVPKEHVAQLNGGAANAGTGVMLGYVGPTATCDESVSTTCLPRLPRSSSISVRNLPQDNTALQATMADVIDVVEGRESAFLWDARNEGQYLGTNFQNANSQAGHPNGALLLEHTDMVDNIGRYKSKDVLRQYLNGELPAGANFQFRTDNNAGGVAVPVGPGNAYQPGQTVITYCETTMRAMLTGTVTSMILGLPTRFYDGAMVEWNSMSHFQDSNNDFILPSDSPWRTDRPDRSWYVYSTTTVDPRIINDPYYDDPDYRVANAIIDADKAYKIGATSTGGSGGGAGGGGGGLPSNPCGG